MHIPDKKTYVKFDNYDAIIKSFQSQDLDDQLFELEGIIGTQEAFDFVVTNINDLYSDLIIEQYGQKIYESRVKK